MPEQNTMLSRVARLPVILPKGVECIVNENSVTIKGPKGSLTKPLHEAVTIKQADGELTISPTGKGEGKLRAIYGTSRALLNNMVIGVTEGYKQEMEVEGTGFRVQLQGNKLNLTLGFSHPVFYEAPEGIKVEVSGNTAFTLTGICKDLIGRATAEILRFKKPNAYKRKGIFKKGQHVRLKEVKKK